MSKNIQHVQKFRSAWLSDPILKSWLLEKKDAQNQSYAYCKDCLAPLYSNKLCDIKKHGTSKKHINNVKQMSGATKQTVIPFEKSKISETQVAEGKMALFIAEHNSINTCDHLTDVCKSYFPDSRIDSQMQMKRSKCSAIIKNVLYSHFMDDIKQSVGDKPFSLLIDESQEYICM